MSMWLFGSLQTQGTELGEPEVRNRKTIGGIYWGYEDPGSYIPIISLLYSWFFLLWGLHFRPFTDSILLFWPSSWPHGASS